MPTALIVEDEPEANRLLCLVVQIRKYRTESAWTGQQALAALDGTLPDIIFLDLMLPDTNGYDLLRRIKARPETTLLPVVVVSARLAEENRMRCCQLGALAYVAKPYMPDQVFQCLTAAERLQADLAATPGHREFYLGADEEEVSRELALLRSQLVARSGLPIETIGTMVGSIREIATSAASWSEKRELERVALVSYQVDAARVTLRIRDESGWFDAGDLTEAAAGFSPGLDKVFHVVERDETGREVVLEHRCEAVESVPQQGSGGSPSDPPTGP